MCLLFPCIWASNKHESHKTHTYTHTPAEPHSAAFKAGKRTQHSSCPTHTNATAGETQLVAVHFVVVVPVAVVVVVVNFNTYLFTQPSTQCTSKKPKQPKQPPSIEGRT